MTVRRPLSLSNAQLHCVMTAARHIGIEYRERFLISIADQLIDSELSDDAVQRAITSALDRLSIRDVA